MLEKKSVLITLTFATQCYMQHQCHNNCEPGWNALALFTPYYMSIVHTSSAFEVSRRIQVHAQYWSSCTYLVGVCAVDEVDKVSQPTSAPPHHRHRHLSCVYVDVYQCHIHSLTRTSLWEHNTTANIQCVPQSDMYRIRAFICA